MAIPNTGPKTAGWLAEVGLDSVDALRAAGAIAAYVRLKHQHPGQVSLNALWAIYGAIHGIPWNRIDPAVKQELLDALPHAYSGTRRSHNP